MPVREPSERVRGALEQIGCAVLKGGMSTLLGVSLLAASPSAIFRIFFECLFSIVILGQLMGLTFLPSGAALLNFAIPYKSAHQPFMPDDSSSAAPGATEPATFLSVEEAPHMLRAEANIRME